MSLVEKLRRLRQENLRNAQTGGLPDLQFTDRSTGQLIFENQIRRLGAERARPHSLPIEFDRMKWMDAKDAAHYLRKSVPALRNMVWRGYLPAHKFHGRLMFRRADLDRLIERSKQGDIR